MISLVNVIKMKRVVFLQSPFEFSLCVHASMAPRPAQSILHSSFFRVLNQRVTPCLRVIVSIDQLRKWCCENGAAAAFPLLTCFYSLTMLLLSNSGFPFRSFLGDFGFSFWCFCVPLCFLHLILRDVVHQACEHFTEFSKS